MQRYRFFRCFAVHLPALCGSASQAYREFSVLSGRNAHVVVKLTVEIRFAFKTAGKGNLADVFVALEKHDGGGIDPLLLDILLRRDPELLCKQVGKIGGGKKHDLPQIGVGNMRIEMAVDVLQNGNEPYRFGGGGNRVRQEKGQKIFDQPFAGDGVGRRIALLIPADMLQKVAENFTHKRRRLGFPLRRVNGQIARRRYIEIEMDPIMPQYFVAMRVENGKGWDKIQFPDCGIRPDVSR